jgi:hypothetical protein
VHLHAVARALGTTVAYLIGESDDPESDMPDLHITADEEEVLVLLRGLSPFDRATVLRLLRALGERAPAPTVHAPMREFKGTGTNG